MLLVVSLWFNCQDQFELQPAFPTSVWALVEIAEGLQLQRRILSW